MNTLIELLNLEKNNNSVAKALYDTIINNKESSFSIDREKLDSVMKNMNIVITGQAKDIISKFKNFAYSYDSDSGKGNIELSFNSEISFNTNLGEVKVTEVVKYSIDFSKKDTLVFTAVDKKNKIKAPLNAGKTFSISKEKGKLFFVKFFKKMEIE